MKGKIIERVAKLEILPHLPEWAVRGKLIYMSGPNDILRGVCIDSSAFSASDVYVQLFAMPLYVPRDHLTFTYGKRLRDSSGWERWSVDPDFPVDFVRDLLTALKADGLRFLEKFATPNGVLTYINASEGGNDFWRLHTKAYTHAYLGNLEKADNLLSILIDEAAKALKNSPWTKNVADHATLLRGYIRRGRDEVHEVMESWVHYSREKLKLPLRI
jgi:hypothetical protein